MENQREQREWLKSITHNLTEVAKEAEIRPAVLHLFRKGGNLNYKNYEKLQAYKEKVSRPEINWKELRDNYFNECCRDITGEMLPRVTLPPHDLFEWFKKEVTKNYNEKY